MGKKIIVLCISIITFVLAGCASTSNHIDTTTVSNLNLNQYLGEWYEIARYDNSFERGLVGTTANYSLRDDGKIQVVNQGYKGSLNGKLSKAEGKAKIPNPDDPAKLKVSFFWFFYSDYFVLELDPNYEWAVVGSSSDKYLWILSRTPQMEDSLYMELLGRLENRGYDTSKLLKVPQPEL